MYQPRISLTREDFNQNATKLYEELLNDKIFTDVTLATNDDVQVKAHQLILSSCSTFFKKILSTNPHPNPLLYLNNVNYLELKSIMEFIYLGECKINKEGIEKFISIGSELKICGISVNPLREKADIGNKDDQLKDMLKKPIKDEIQNVDLEFVLDKSEQEEDSVDWWSISNADTQKHRVTETVNVAKLDFPTDLTESLKAKPFSCEICVEKFAYSKSLKKHKRLTGHGTKLKCDVCKFDALNEAQIINHWKEEHIGNESVYGCSLCDKTFPKYSALTKHKKYMHGKIAFSCSKCDYKAPKQGILNKHISVKHDGVRVVCELCNTNFVSLANLRVHKQNIHDGIRYPCDKCDYSATQIQGLRSHQKVQHQGLRYECDQCGFKATGKSNLQVHKETKHEHRKYYCNQCDFTANHPSSLNHHMKTKHEENLPIKCDKCTKEYTGYDGQQKLRRHKNRIHNGVRFECDQCDHLALYSHGLANHKSLKHA